jgi:hypothetical protein
MLLGVGWDSSTKWGIGWVKGSWGSLSFTNVRPKNFRQNFRSFYWAE